MPAYDRTRMESWACCYLVCRTLGITPSEFLGFKKCEDGCWVVRLISQCLREPSALADGLFPRFEFLTRR
jgi:hypothetical protein